MCVTAKRDFLMGIHTQSDHYKLALYTSLAELSPRTEVYLPTHEVMGKGYERGGQVLRGYQCGLDNGVAVLGWRESLVWEDASISAAGALVYNASKGNRAVVVIDFGRSVVSTDGSYRLLMPPVSADTALVRIF